MNNKLKSILGDEVMQFMNELLDPNAGSTYYPPGLDPKVVKLFEDGISTLIDETYESVSELRKLASDVIMETAEQNYERHNQIGKFDYLYGIPLQKIDHEKYDKISEFIKNTNITFHFLPKKGSVKGSYMTYRDKTYDPSVGREIEVYVDYHNMKKKVDEKLKEGKITAKDLYYLIHSYLFSTLIHELQHAFDDYRSKNKIYYTKEYKKYLEKYLKNKIRDDQYRDFEKVKSYFNLPHEIWARFSQTVQKIPFYTFDIDEKNEKLVHFMNPLKEVVKDFIRSFEGYSVLPEKMKRKLINKVVQFWHYEKEKIPEMNEKGI